MTALAGVDARALEIRFLLDLVVFEVQRLDLPAGTVVSVRTASEDLASGLRDRLWPDFRVEAHAAADLVVHLLDLEAGGVPDDGRPERRVIAFRNAWSHKRLRRGWRGLSFAGLERRLRRDHDVVASRGVMTLPALAGLTLAGAATGAGLHGWGFHLSDRAVLAPSATSRLRYLCPYGMIHARRRC